MLPRAAQPVDAVLFVGEGLARVRAAAHDLSWLLSRDYSVTAALKLTGDRYELDARQRIAARRSACSDQARARRLALLRDPASLRGQVLLVDGFNVLTTLEAALGGAVILAGRDGCYRDMEGIHGSYRDVPETRAAVDLLIDYTASLGISRCSVLLDRPVSHSGALKALLLEICAERGASWEVSLVNDPDRELRAAQECVATADSAVIDDAVGWLNLAREIIARSVPGAWVIDFGADFSR
ncbi:MAG: DUF434 domain-containing protein [Byssovorax sp.]